MNLIKKTSLISFALVLSANFLFAQNSWNTTTVTGNDLSAPGRNNIFGTTGFPNPFGKRDIRFFTFGFERMRLIGEPGPTIGFLGIGLTNPSFRLDVQDNINLNTTVINTAYHINGFTVLQVFGTRNLCAGVESGFANSGGTDNVFLGYRAGYNNDFGFRNTFVGSNAGLSLAGAGNDFNTFIGTDAGMNLSFGRSNTFVGEHSGYRQFSGDQNAYFGSHSGQGQPNSTGSRNTFIGTNAGPNVSNSNNNTFVGFSSGGGCNLGVENSFLGMESGNTTSLGSFNVFLGFHSGDFNTQGDSNTYIGYRSGPLGFAFNNLFNANAIGINARVTKSQTLILGNNKVNVGIGFSGDINGPIAKLDVRELIVSDDALIAGRFLCSGNTTALLPIYFGVIGTSNVNGAIFNTGVSGEGFGISSMRNTGVFGHGAGTPTENYGGYFVADGSIGKLIGVYGEAGVGSGNLAGFFNGDVNRTGTDNFTSDANLKTNITTISDPWSILSQLMPKSFFFDTVSHPYMNLPKRKQYGFVAQDIEPILPELVTNAFFPDKVDSSGNILAPGFSYKTLNYQAFIGLMMAGMKEMKEQLDSLQNNARIMSSSSSNNNQTVELSSDVILYQNMPNPFSDETVINYFLPDNVNTAKMLFYDETGRVIKEETIDSRGNGSLTLKTSNLASGVYTYSLEVNGKIIQVRKMQKTK
jgi:hypothetical protein